MSGLNRTCIRPVDFLTRPVGTIIIISLSTESHLNSPNNLRVNNKYVMLLFWVIFYFYLLIVVFSFDLFVIFRFVDCYILLSYCLFLQFIPISILYIDYFVSLTILYIVCIVSFC